jgi:hypothetical protein
LIEAGESRAARAFLEGLVEGGDLGVTENIDEGMMLAGTIADQASVDDDMARELAGTQDKASFWDKLFDFFAELFTLGLVKTDTFHGKTQTTPDRDSIPLFDNVDFTRAFAAQPKAVSRLIDQLASGHGISGDRLAMLKLGEAVLTNPNTSINSNERSKRENAVSKILGRLPNQQRLAYIDGLARTTGAERGYATMLLRGVKLSPRSPVQQRIHVAQIALSLVSEAKEKNAPLSVEGRSLIVLARENLAKAAPEKPKAVAGVLTQTLEEGPLTRAMFGEAVFATLDKIPARNKDTFFHGLTEHTNTGDQADVMVALLYREGGGIDTGRLGKVGDAIFQGHPSRMNRQLYADIIAALSMERDGSNEAPLGQAIPAQLENNLNAPAAAALLGSLQESLDASRFYQIAASSPKVLEDLIHASQRHSTLQENLYALRFVLDNKARFDSAGLKTDFDNSSKVRYGRPSEADTLLNESDWNTIFKVAQCPLNQHRQSEGSNVTSMPRMAAQKSLETDRSRSSSRTNRTMPVS